MVSKLYGALRYSRGRNYVPAPPVGSLRELLH